MFKLSEYFLAYGEYVFNSMKIVYILINKYQNW